MIKKNTSQVSVYFFSVYIVRLMEVPSYREFRNSKMTEKR